MTEMPESIAVESDVSITEAMRVIDRNALGIVFVTSDSGELVGVATDGDIRRGILEGHELDDAVKRIMNDSPVRVYESWSEERVQDYVDQSEVSDKMPPQGALTAPVIDDEDRVVDYVYLSENGAQRPTRKTGSSSGSAETVLVIGGAGYIGSALCRELLENGYTVRVLDTLLYGDYGISDIRDHDRFTLVEGDMRSIETVVEGIKGADAVVHLGALVGDPASGIDPQKTLEINYHSTKMIAEVCKYHQINRLIFASTCSVYGKAEHDELLTESSSLNPVSLYAQSKIQSEQALLDMEDENFSPTVFRMATIYGLAPRMRFDLVVNILSAKAHFEGTVPIFGGDQYRPFVHVRDAARAYLDCLEAPISDVSGTVFNIGSNDQNHRVIEVGEIVSESFPSADLDHQADKEDERSYQVDFTRAAEVLGFEPDWTVRSGVEDIKDALEAGEFDDYTLDKYSNYKTVSNNMDDLRRYPAVQ